MKNNNLIAVSGMIGSGKDTVTKIIQILEMFPEMSTPYIIKNINKHFDNYGYENKKFAENVKQMLCIISGCKRESLEQEDFKNSPMGPQWDRYAYFREGTRKPLRIYPTREEAEEQLKIFGGGRVEEIVMTYRLALQLIGTDLFRNMFHENTWVNSLFSKYTSHSKWIVSDMRFPNEFEAVYNRNGITIKVIRYKTSEEWLKTLSGVTIIDPDGWDRTTYEYSFYKEKISKKEFIERVMMSTVKRDMAFDLIHKSERALDNENRFDFTIHNEGSLEDLVEDVRLIFNEIKMDKIYRKFKVVTEKIEDINYDHCKDSAGAFEFCKKIFDMETINVNMSCKAILLGSDLSVIGYIELGSGNYKSHEPDLTSLYHAVIHSRAISVIFVHNHTSGIVKKPSKESLNLAMKLKESLRILSSQLTDFMIISKDTYYSFQQNDCI